MQTIFIRKSDLLESIKRKKEKEEMEKKEELTTKHLEVELNKRKAYEEMQESTLKTINVCVNDDWEHLEEYTKEELELAEEVEKEWLLKQALVLHPWLPEEILRHEGDLPKAGEVYKNFWKADDDKEIEIMLTSKLFIDKVLRNRHAVNNKMIKQGRETLEKRKKIAKKARKTRQEPREDDLN